MLSRHASDTTKSDSQESGGLLKQGLDGEADVTSPVVRLGWFAGSDRSFSRQDAESLLLLHTSLALAQSNDSIEGAGRCSILQQPRY